MTVAGRGNSLSRTVSMLLQTGVNVMSKSMDTKKDAKKKPGKTMKEKKAEKKAKKDLKSR